MWMESVEVVCTTIVTTWLPATSSAHLKKMKNLIITISQSGNFRSFLSFRFYVKSILENTGFLKLLSKFELSKSEKHFPKLISRKIWTVIEKSWNFQNVDYNVEEWRLKYRWRRRLILPVMISHVPWWNLAPKSTSNLRMIKTVLRSEN